MLPFPWPKKECEVAEKKVCPPIFHGVLVRPPMSACPGKRILDWSGVGCRKSMTLLSILRLVPYPGKIVGGRIILTAVIF